MTEQELQAIKERLLNMPEGWTISEGVKLIEQLSFDGIKLIAEVERLCEALEYYADEKNHVEPRGTKIFGDIFYDKGKTARAALAGDSNE